MSDPFVEIGVGGLRLRADTFLVMLTVVLGFIAVMVGLIAATRKRRRNGNSDESIIAFLSKPEVLNAINGDQGKVVEVIKLLRTERDEEKPELYSNPLNRIIDKINSDISWDIAGVIGVAVTIVLLFMVVSGTIKQVPDQLFTGWLMILGYYFGKSTKGK